MAFAPCGRIDTHLHLAYENGDRGGRVISTHKEMLPHFEKLNIVKGVVLAGGALLPDLPGNEECEAIYQADPVHYAWMCSPEPLNPDTVYDTLKNCKDRGAVGVGELTVNLPLTDPALTALFDAAGKLQLPVTLHMSPEVGCSYGVVDGPGLPLLEECLGRFPDTVFVGHSACFWCEISGDAPTASRERNGYPKTAVLPGGRITELLEKYPNLYCDLSATSGGQAILRDEAHGLHFLERFADRMIFATDMIKVGSEYPLYTWLDQMAEEGKLSMETYRKICRGNAEKLYRL